MMLRVNGLTSLLFAGLAASGCVLWGACWSSSLSRRVSALLTWSRILVRMEAALEYRGQSLEELLELSVQGETDREIKLSLEKVACKMRASPLLSLKESFDEGSLHSLKDGDKAALSPLWHGLGNGDAAMQRALLQSVQKAIAAQIDQAKNQANKDQRLALSLGLIGGGVVFLFLL